MPLQNPIKWKNLKPKPHDIRFLDIQPDAENKNIVTEAIKKNMMSSNG